MSTDGEKDRVAEFTEFRRRMNERILAERRETSRSPETPPDKIAIATPLIPIPPRRIQNPK